MAYTEVLIANMALGRIGQSVAIESLTESTTAARVCNTYYVPSRDFVLRAFNWPFARETFTLNQLGEDPTDDWAYYYQVPADCIKARKIVSGTRRNPAGPKFHIAESAAGKVLYTDEGSPVVLEYTKLMTDPTYFDADFASALAWRLASEIALPLTRDPSAGSGAANNFQIELAIAAANAGNEQIPDEDPESEFIRLRSGS